MKKKILLMSLLAAGMVGCGDEYIPEPDVRLDAAGDGPVTDTATRDGASTDGRTDTIVAPDAPTSDAQPDTAPTDAGTTDALPDARPDTMVPDSGNDASPDVPSVI